jgi:hypothetical protein
MNRIVKDKSQFSKGFRIKLLLYQLVIDDLHSIPNNLNPI